jgi:hypothetical protein
LTHPFVAGFVPRQSFWRLQALQTVSLAYGGAGLGTMWGKEAALAMLAAAGFTGGAVEQLAHDFQNNYYIVRRG